jgi:hypothetical protein
VPAAAVTRHGDRVLLFVRRGGNVDVHAIEVLADDGRRGYVSGGLDAEARRFEIEALLPNIRLPMRIPGPNA